MNFAQNSWLVFQRELMIRRLQLAALPRTHLAAAKLAEGSDDWGTERDKARRVLLTHQDTPAGLAQLEHRRGHA